MRVEQLLTELVESTMERALGEHAAALLKPTQDEKHGDYQINGVLPLAKAKQAPPRTLAEPVAAALRDDPRFSRVEVAGPGFINLTLSPGWIGEELARVGRGEAPAVSAVATPERVVIDFSSPNIAKQMHVGHLRSTILGAALRELASSVGHRPYGVNHLGDWGTQFGLLIVGMRELGSQEALARSPIDELERVYKLASARAKEDEAFAEAARAELAKLQSNDPENRAQWEMFVKATRASLDAVYATLGVSFDSWMGESAYHDALPGVVRLLEDKGIARESEGALGVFFAELEAAPEALRKVKEPFLIRKKDGAFLYATTDIAAVLHRAGELAADRILYVVDHRQGLHFRQLFAVAAMLGVKAKLDHVGFGAILGNDNKPLKTRDGTAITLTGLLDEATQRAEARIREEGLDIPEAEIAEVARVVGIGAVKYADLRQNRSSDYVFDWDKMISFKGNAGPYLQYAYARIQSIFRKGEIEKGKLSGAIALSAPEELRLGRRLLAFDDVVHGAEAAALPHLVCDHLFAVARDFSSFYEACPVLKSDGATRESRLMLCKLAGAQLKDGLAMLGIGTVERM